MNTNQTAELQALLARWLRDGDDASRRRLIDAAYERLRRLAAVILNESFPRLKGAPVHMETTDLANEAALGMYQALDEIRPATLRDFFRLAAQRMRWLMLDRAKRLDRERRHAREVPAADASSDRPVGGEPLEVLEALYRQIDALGEGEREVVDLVYFHGLTQAEAAALMGVTERTIRRYWTAARLKLYRGLKDQVPLAAGPLSVDPS